MRKAGILPACCTEQRLALDAGLCGGLIRGKGARLRIRHRLAPLPLAAPRDAACAAPPASPSPECGIEGIPAADGRIVRLEEAAASGRQKASCQPHRRHPCRRATAALVASSIEMAVRDGGSSSRVGLAGHGSRRLRPSRGQDRPPSTSLVRTRPLPARFPPGQAHNRSSTSRGTLSRSSPPQVV